LHFSEFVLDLSDDIIEVLTDLEVRGEGVQELHVIELVDNVVLERLLDETHRDLLLTLGGVRDNLHAVLIELDDTLHHTNGLGERAVVIVIGESVLLEEFILNDRGSLEDGLLIFGKGIFTNQLHNFDKLVFLLEDLTGGFLQIHEVRLHLGVVLFEDGIVRGETQVPVNTGEMLTFGQVFVETPEDLHDRESSRGNGIGEITTGRGDSTDNGDRSLSVG